VTVLEPRIKQRFFNLTRTDLKLWSWKIKSVFFAVAQSVRIMLRKLRVQEWFFLSCWSHRSDSYQKKPDAFLSPKQGQRVAVIKMSVWTHSGLNPGARNYFSFLLMPSSKETSPKQAQRVSSYKNVSLDSFVWLRVQILVSEIIFYSCWGHRSGHHSKKPVTFLSPEQAIGVEDTKMSVWTHVHKSCAFKSRHRKWFYFLVESIDHSKSKETSLFLITWTSHRSGRYKNVRLNSCSKV